MSTHTTTVGMLATGHRVPFSQVQAMIGEYATREVSGPVFDVASLVRVDPYDPYYRVTFTTGTVVDNVRGDLRVVRVAS